MELSSLKIHNLDLYSAILRLVGVFVFTYAGLRYFQAKRSPLNAIPTVGHSGILTSYITAYKWMRSANELVKEGYTRYPGRPFKVATMSRWVVVLSGKTAVDDVCRASDDIISFRDAITETTQMKYTLGQAFDDDAYHVETVRSPVTRNLVSRFDDIRDEIVESFKDYIPCKDEWVTVPAYATLMHIICRTSNRYFVGLPLCRNPGYLALNEGFAMHVARSSRVINCFPPFLKPLVGRYLTTVPETVKKAIGYLGPTLEERLAKDEEHGPNWPGRPNDLISWLLDTISGDHLRNVRDLTLRIVTVNFAAIHTSTISLAHGLFNLAIYPEYVKEMREEAEAAIAELGWTKAAMQKMRKVDSFLKESQRLNSASVNMNRIVLRDWTLSDGTLLPAGTFFGFASDAMNTEEESFSDGLTFKGFRFAKMRDGGGELDSIKHQMVSLNHDHIIFGHGRHACPGRFFAVNEIKAMFAHILLDYDVQLEGGSMERPPNIKFLVSVFPNRSAKVMFRKRAVV